METDIYRTKHTVRFVTAASLFDGHDASINLFRRLLQASGAEVIHLGHNRSVDEIVEANQEGADECLVKPVNPAVLVVKAMAWLGHGQRSERAPTMLGVTL